MTGSAYQMLCRSCLRRGYDGGAAPPATCPYCGSDDVRSSRELFGLTIAHMDCDAFYASVEKRDDPSIRDRPVIVGGRERGVVAAACYIARRYGIRSAMPTWQALKRCPDAVVIRPRMSHYTAISREIRSRMLALTPLVQPLSIDEAFLDLAGTESLHGCPPAEALVRLQRGIREEIGITVSIGLSGTKSLAKMASDRDKPNGFFAVDMDSAAAWLAPQPVSVLFGLGKAAVARLNASGIETCGDLVAAPDGQLAGLLGKSAPTIRDLAAGIDPRPVSPDREAKSISSETTFVKDLSTAAELEAELEMLCRKVSTRLKAQNLACGRVTRVTRPQARFCAFSRVETLRHSISSSASSSAAVDRSFTKVVSLEMLFASRSGDTGRGSIPAARSRIVGALLPRRPASCPSGAATRSPHVSMPDAFSRATAALPRPNSTDTGCGASQAAALSISTAKKPLGLSRSDAIFASDLVPLSPIETVMPISSRIPRCRRTSASAGGQPCRDSVPARSRKASSIDSGWTSGVSASMRDLISRLIAV